ncbi:MAG TPA: ATPase domain-containing protein, partial [Candidatus Wallbacteria bacterium]|nr:ATPase domain-containing protein [Candidatus Wallbacteria bacterium]
MTSHGVFDRLNSDEFANYICESCEKIFEHPSDKCPSCGFSGPLQKIEITPKSYDDYFGLFEEEEQDEELSRRDPVSASRISHETSDAPDKGNASAKLITSGINEFDELFGGGLHSGSLSLLFGDPGNGKTTFLLKVAEAYAISGHSTLFISSEESFHRLSSKVQKLSIGAPRLYILSISDIDMAISEIVSCKPEVVILDSATGFFKKTIDAIPSSHIQIRECTAHLKAVAAENNLSILMSAQNLYSSCYHEFDSISSFFDAMLVFEARHPEIRMLRVKKSRDGMRGDVRAFKFENNALIGVGENALALQNGEPPINYEKNATGSISCILMEGASFIGNTVETLVGPYPARDVRWNIDRGISRDVFDTVSDIIEKYLEIKLFERNISVRLGFGGSITDPAFELTLAAAI